MRIGAVNNFNYNVNKPSFGKFVPSDQYKNDLIKHNQEHDLCDLLNKQGPISVKKLLDYDKLSHNERVTVDRFLKLMPPEEVEDLTVEISTISANNCYDQYDKRIYEHVINLTYGFPRNNIYWNPSMDSWASTTFNSCYGFDGASPEEKSKILEQYSDKMVKKCGFKLRNMDEVPVLADRDVALNRIADQMKKAFISVN